MSLDVRIIGPGRAGGALADALSAAGWSVELWERDRDPGPAAGGTRLLILAVPDPVIASVSQAVAPGEACVVHLAGALSLAPLAAHRRAASVHPLVALPDRASGAARLPGSWFAVAGDPEAVTIVEALDGRTISVPDEHRAAYHAAAVVASNHLVALLGQAERIAARADVPLEAYLDLVRATVENVAELGPAGALTGPVARGDWETVARHLGTLDERERPAYRIMADMAQRLVDDARPGGRP